MVDKKFKIGDRVETSGLHDVFDDHIEGVVKHVYADVTNMVLVLRDSDNLIQICSCMLIYEKSDYDQDISELSEKISCCC